MRVRFEEGQVVKPGEFLAEIDPRPFQVQLAQAEGQLAKDQALLKNAQLDLERYRTLLAQDSIAQAAGRHAGRAGARSTRARCRPTRARSTARKLQLTYARITAPIGGRVGLRQVDPGNIVRARDANGIVVITQLQPITRHVHDARGQRAARDAAAARQATPTVGRGLGPRAARRSSPPASSSPSTTRSTPPPAR